MKCDICTREEVEWICAVCDYKMVCADCDKKWHQHPKRRNHQRELLKFHPTEVANVVRSDHPPALGSFTRTAATSKNVADLSVPPDARKDPMPNGRDAAQMYPESESGDFSASQPAHLLPKSVAEINADLSYRSLLGDRNSLLPERISSNHEVAEAESNLGRANSLTSDFLTTLENLQLKMEEVSSSVLAGGQAELECWSLSPPVDKPATAESGPGWNNGSTSESHSVGTTAPVSTNSGSSDLDLLLARTKYPPSGAGHPVLPSADHSGKVASATARNFGRSDASGFSGLRETAAEPTSVEFPVDRQPRKFDASRTRVKSMSRSSAAGTRLANVSQPAFAFARQRSQTLVKERLTDVPGAVLPRVGDGKDLGVVERSEPDFHSRFSDIHDEVQFVMCRVCF